MIMNESIETPLHQAANYKGMLDIARMHMDAGYDLNALWNGKTPLWCALVQKNLPLVELLLERGADPHLGNPLLPAVSAVNQFYPPRPLQKAETLKALTLLLEKGVDVNVQDERGMTALHLSHDPEVIAMLVARGALVNARSQEGKTPLHLIAGGYPESPEAVELLLQHGADVDARDRKGNTPLIYAAQMKIEEHILPLLKAGADPNVTDRKKRTPLHLAASVHAMEAVSALLAAGAEVNAKDSKGNTSLALVEKWIYLGDDPYYGVGNGGEGNREEFARNAEDTAALLREAGAEV
jgi:ankyrin repeat protein